MGFAELFSGPNFQRTVSQYCAHRGWRVADLNNERAILRFNMNSGRTQSLFILRYDTTLEFSVQSIARFPNENAIPHYFSTLLLQRSAERKVGFWCIEKIGGEYIYSCMHNAELQLLDAPYFCDVVWALVTECDEFETMLVNMVRR